MGAQCLTHFPTPSHSGSNAHLFPFHSSNHGGLRTTAVNAGFASVNSHSDHRMEESRVDLRPFRKIIYQRLDTQLCPSQPSSGVTRLFETVLNNDSEDTHQMRRRAAWTWNACKWSGYSARAHRPMIACGPMTGSFGCFANP